MPHFANPGYLFLLVVIPLLAWRYLRRMRGGEGSLRCSTAAAFKGLGSQWTVRVRHAVFGAKMLALALMITAFARPQKGTQEEEFLTEGIDIVIAIDTSGSMAAEDFEPRNRMYVAKLVAGKFIEGLRNDRVGLVAFAAKAVTRSPLTLDYGALLHALDSIQLGIIEDGTAIGNALATCLNRLRDSKAKSKVIILVTDGMNNRGEVQPLDAARIAKALGVRIYTIGVGSQGTARFPVDDPNYGKIYVNLPVEIDETSLTAIARDTGGIYYRATDTPSLEKIFQDIAGLEKTQVQVKSYTHYNEQFIRLLRAALVIALLGTVAGCSRFGKLP